MRFRRTDDWKSQETDHQEECISTGMYVHGWYAEDNGGAHIKNLIDQRKEEERKEQASFFLSLGNTPLTLGILCTSWVSEWVRGQ